MIHPHSTCDYEATLEEVRPNETVWSGRETKTAGKRLAGRAPRICIDRRRLAMTAKSPKDALYRQVRFLVGDAVFRQARPGDRLFVTHTGNSGLGVSLLRAGRLVLAFGAVGGLPLGDTVRLIVGSTHGASEEDSSFLQVSAEGRQARIRTRELRKVGPYMVYMERGPDFDRGFDEQAAIAVEDEEGMELGAARAAILSAAFPRVYRWFEWSDP